MDADRQPILERSEVYSGVYGRASINLYAFNSNGNKGIACGLNNLQKIRDGEPLGCKSRAEDDFATADDEDDFANSVINLIGNIICLGLLVTFLVGLIFGIKFMIQAKTQDKEEYERKKAKDELDYKETELRYKKLLEDKR